MRELQFIGGVKWDSTYKDVLRFPSKTIQEEYFSAKVTRSIENIRFVSPQRTLRVEIEFDDAINEKYLRYWNHSAGRWMYAFITSISYQTEALTNFDIEIDVMQTYQFDYDLGECFVDREHQNRFTLEGGVLKRKYNIVPEPLDYGSRYVSKASADIREMGYSLQDSSRFIFPIVIVKSTNNGIYGSKYGIQSPFTFLVSFAVSLPNPEDGIDTSANVWRGVVRLASLTEILKKYQDDASVLSISLLPYSIFNMTVTNPTPNDYYIKVEDRYDVGLLTESWMGGPANLTTMFVLKILNIEKYQRLPLFMTKSYREMMGLPIISFSPKQPARLTNESKLFISPYSYFMLYSNLQNNIQISPETIVQDNPLIEYSVSMSGVQFKEYLRGFGTEQIFAEIIDPTNKELPLITDAYKNYMTQRKNSIVTGMAVPIASTVLGIGATALGGGAVGVPLIMGGITSSASVIAGEMAKQKDLRLLPDNIRNQGNNIEFDYITNRFRYKMEYFEITPDVKQRLFKYFMRFGYKSNEFKVPNLNSRYYYNFIKTIETTIFASLNNSIINQLKEIYQRGVTFWHFKNNEEDLFKYDYENYEVIL